jgi:hypothetical protein
VVEKVGGGGCLERTGRARFNKLYLGNHLELDEVHMKAFFPTVTDNASPKILTLSFESSCICSQ